MKTLLMVLLKVNVKQDDSKSKISPNMTIEKHKKDT